MNHPKFGRKNITQIMTYCYNLTSHYVLKLGKTRKDNIKIDLKETVLLDLERIHQAENRNKCGLLLTGH
jgi:hypothetical protein